jgi:sugar/nucleoside kinase (ribokinase family)
MVPSALDVVTIGNAIVDMLTTVDDAFIQRHALTKGTMRLIEQDEAERLYADMPPAKEISGGSAANTAVGVASFGGRAGFCGKVNDDELGHIFAHDIAASGVLFLTEPSPATAATARSMVLVTPDAERTMNTFLGAAAELVADELDEQAFTNASISYIEGYLWDPPAAREALRRVVRLAHGGGKRVAFALSDLFCVERHRDDFLALLAAGDVDNLFGNEDELQALYGEDLEAGLKHASAVCEVVAITRGAAGSVVVSGDERVAIPAEPVDRVVDTTGAGDLYAAGVLFGMTTGRDLPVCARLGGIAAAEIISHIGARPEQRLADLATL